MPALTETLTPVIEIPLVWDFVPMARPGILVTLVVLMEWNLVLAGVILAPIGRGLALLVHLVVLV